MPSPHREGVLGTGGRSAREGRPSLDALAVKDLWLLFPLLFAFLTIWAVTEWSWWSWLLPALLLAAVVWGVVQWVRRDEPPTWFLIIVAALGLASIGTRGDLGFFWYWFFGGCAAGLVVWLVWNQGYDYGYGDAVLGASTPKRGVTKMDLAKRRAELRREGRLPPE